MLKKSFVSIIIMLFVLGMCVNVNAAQTNLNIVEKTSKTKYLDNNQGNLQNKIVSYNSEEGTVTMQLSLSNTKQTYENTEILIIMEENLANNTKKFNQYVSQINSLASKAFLFTSNFKIGIIGMKGTISDRKVDVNGNLVINEKDQGKTKGSANDAEVLVNFTNNAQDLTKALKNMNSEQVTYNNNLQAALKLAKSTYSNKANKILVTLFEDVPSTAIGVCKEADASQYQSMEEAAIAKNNDIVSKTKTELLSLKKESIDLILLKPENTDFTQKWYSETGELECTLDGSKYAESLYGTLKNPTYGKMYSLESDTLETVLISNMLIEFMQESTKNMTSVVVKSYFPEEIIDNYQITIEKQSTGKIDTSQYAKDNYITWNIGTLEENKTATMQYTLKLNNTQNTNIVNQTMAINEKLEVSYQDADEETYTTVSTSSPTIQLTTQSTTKTTKTTNNSSSQKQDNTTAKGNIPQTGIQIGMWMGLLILIMMILANACKKYYKNRDIK